MSKKYLINETTLTDIANAIREKTDESNAISVTDFANTITSISSGGQISTCTVTLTGDDPFISKVIYQKLENGNVITVHAGGNENDVIFYDVVCPSLFCAFDQGNDLIPDYVTGNGTLEYVSDGLDAAIIKADGDCSIHLAFT